MIETSVYVERRATLVSKLGDGLVLVPSAPVFPRNGDVEHPYRQDSDFFYLTGFDEPEAVLVCASRFGKTESFLFLRERNLEREIWDGPRLGTERAPATLGLTAAYPIEEFSERLSELLHNVEQVAVPLARGSHVEADVLGALQSLRGQSRRRFSLPTRLVDLTAPLHEMRLIKQVEEIDIMRRAAAITQHAHHEAMRSAHAGKTEYQIDSVLQSVFRDRGSERVAYESIVGTGDHATILHYRAGKRVIADGDLVLIDAGCELEGYASDVTRTFPANGVFTAPQRKLYEIVLRAEEEAIAAVRPGATVDGVHDVAVRVLVEGLLDVGLLQGDLKSNLESGAYKQFYMHRTSHWLGMDVHDVGPYYDGETPRSLAAGMVLTIEPGLYIGKDAEVDAQWRGIGIRIEDDILVTQNGYENLTAGIKKTVRDIEEHIRSCRS